MVVQDRAFYGAKIIKKKEYTDLNLIKWPYRCKNVVKRLKKRHGNERFFEFFHKFAIVFHHLFQACVNSSYC
jgi:hypothetical protein